ncbi:hypothetical protein HID58_018908 [Brassica napus]|uniref:Uncharacterized protein n=1 Tax=Brassica napus TaxID=3708 RepID=A0ABQ7XJE9_BRANA|nr:hypothetical protein HID58_020341 [Brassica napus]KAH0926652.1 hypothetical protein HID58_018908 [Brassica napus]
MSTTNINSKDTVEKGKEITGSGSEVMVVKDHTIHNGGNGSKNSADDGKNGGNVYGVEE